ncbi:hypothetical protein ACFSTE_00160 [Aquimarina hainanensis]|uniref:Uncharacterized protein n=1 Tax=Aquimarina hainanensis TaxID=1578017 RepID=A0ABW5N2E1_9FLAO
MKRLIISAFALSLLFTSYEKEANSLTPDAASENSEQNAVIKRKCHSAEILKKTIIPKP